MDEAGNDGRTGAIDPSGRLDQPGKFRIVKDERRAVGRRAQVTFDAVAFVYGRREGSRSVLNDAFGGVMQAAVRDRAKEGAVEHSVTPARRR